MPSAADYRRWISRGVAEAHSLGEALLGDLLDDHLQEMVADGRIIQRFAASRGGIEIHERLEAVLGDLQVEGGVHGLESAVARDGGHVHFGEEFVDAASRNSSARLFSLSPASGAFSRQGCRGRSKRSTAGVSENMSKAGGPGAHFTRVRFSLSRRLFREHPASSVVFLCAACSHVRGFSTSFMTHRPFEGSLLGVVPHRIASSRCLRRFRSPGGISPGLRERVSGFMGEGAGVNALFSTRISVDTLSMSSLVCGGKGSRLPGKRCDEGKEACPGEKIEHDGVRGPAPSLCCSEASSTRRQLLSQRACHVV
jgi:hypothetical protein